MYQFLTAGARLPFGLCGRASGAEFADFSFSPVK
jgi:hypothetical protein